MRLSIHLSWDDSTSLSISSSPRPYFLHCFLIPLTLAVDISGCFVF